MEYTLNNTKTRKFDIQISGGATINGKELKFDWNGVELALVDVPQIANWTAHTTSTVSGVIIPAGSGILRITLVGGSGADLDWVKFTLSACKGDYNLSKTIDPTDFAKFGQNYKVNNIQCSLDIVGGNCYLDPADFQEFASLYKSNDACMQI